MTLSGPGYLFDGKDLMIFPISLSVNWLTIKERTLVIMQRAVLKRLFKSMFISKSFCL